MSLSSRSHQDADACTSCLAGMHAFCDTDPCCCGGAADLDTRFMDQEVESISLLKEIRVAYGLAKDRDVDEGAIPGAQPREEPPLGDSGYIHPDAWGSTQDIGTFTDPLSTGRKRQGRMYPISKGQTCEWAGKLVKLADLPVVVGCMNAAATDLHHGPDKNTLNNEKVTHGVGLRENTHIICSECHNSLHAKHDPFYEKYDRVADQEKPWLVRGLTLADQYILEDAPLELLFAEEAKRVEDRARRGKTTRGRKARTQQEGNFDVREEE